MEGGDTRYWQRTIEAKVLLRCGVPHILVSCDLRGGGRLALFLLLALGRGPLFCGSPYQCFPSAPLIPPSANPSFRPSRGSWPSSLQGLRWNGPWTA